MADYAPPPAPQDYTGDTPGDSQQFEAYNHGIMAWQFEQLAFQIYEKALLKDAMGSLVVTNIVDPSRSQ